MNEQVEVFGGLPNREKQVDVLLLWHNMNCSHCNAGEAVAVVAAAVGVERDDDGGGCG